MSGWDDARAPLDGAKSMPAEFYTSPEVFELERRHVLQRHWFFLGRADMVPHVGDYLTADTVGGPVIVIRGDRQEIEVLANVCRHRGSKLLLDRSGSASHLVCPYHGWSYTCSGRLIGAPDMHGVKGFDRQAASLVPIRHEVWNGFIFATFHDDDIALTDHLGDLPARMASHRLDEMRCTWTWTVETRCNWKLILENAMETYHTGILHRATVGRQTSRTLTTRGNWRAIQVISGRSIATLPGQQPPFPPITGLDDDAQQGTYFTLIHPACQFAIAQDCLWWLNVTPLGHDRSRLDVGGCFPEAYLDDPLFAEKAQPYYDRWEAVALEDVGILEHQQQALSSLRHQPGSLSWRDDEVQAVGRWVLDRLPI